MSMSSYTYRERACGPEFYTGPRFSNRNARLVLLSRGYGPECFSDGDVAGPFEPRELKGRLLLAVAVVGALPDHGTPSVQGAGETAQRRHR
jgi:hypothetical protein